MKKARMLVVEDERVVAMDIQRGLTRLGYPSPEVASSGDEAVRMATQLRPDLVLMDIRLKGSIDGIEAAERIRRRLGIPVVYLTAYADDTTLERAARTQPYGYILKPFREKDLDASIEVALYKHERDTQSKQRFRRKVERIEKERESLRRLTMDLQDTVKETKAQLEALRSKRALARELRKAHPDWPQKRIAAEVGVTRAAIGHSLKKDREERFPPTEYCGSGEAALILGISRKSVAAWVRNGRLRAERFGPGGPWMFERRYLRSVLEGSLEPSDNSVFITAAQAADLLGLQRRTLWQWARREKIAAVKLADTRGWRFNLEDIKKAAQHPRQV